VVYPFHLASTFSPERLQGKALMRIKAFFIDYKADRAHSLSHLLEHAGL
jgi:hypothetical protein